jgi:hypothetical protein
VRFNIGELKMKNEKLKSGNEKKNCVQLKTSHGMAEDNSLRREPWESGGIAASPGGATEFLSRDGFLSPLCGFEFPTLEPTADAVGYPLSLLRS